MRNSPAYGRPGSRRKDSVQPHGQVYGESDFPVVQGRVIGVLRWLAN